MSTKDDEGYILSGLFESTTVPMGQRKHKLFEAVLVHCTDVLVHLERLCGEKKLELGTLHCGKRFLKCTLILFEYLLYASLSYVLQNSGSRKTILRAVCLAGL